MKRSTDRILTTHVGSLIRPVPILKAMRERVMHRPYDQAVFDDQHPHVAAPIKRSIVAKK